MSLGFPVLARRRTVVLCDAALALWIAAWIVVGMLVSREVHALRSFGDTLDSASEALHQTADGLHTVGKVPFVGHRIEEISQSINTTSDHMAANAKDTRHAVDRLSLLLPFCLSAAAALPVLAIYLPLRVRRIRVRRALRLGLRRDGREPVERYLAERAVVELPYDRLHRVSEDPWRDLASGHYEALAASQLDRLDLPRTEESG